eukprot:2552282-Rhodomonas_salina.2
MSGPDIARVAPVRQTGRWIATLFQSRRCQVTTTLRASHYLISDISDILHVPSCPTPDPSSRTDSTDVIIDFRVVSQGACLSQS